uniref:Store-operated calcium entry-associated regulatory factor n=1 Tax=Acrobeloides nanus TaxID=290746 RepID=A0A914CRI5_9BILA
MELSLAYMVHLMLIILYICSFVSHKKHRIKSNIQKIEARLLYQGFISAIPCLLMITFHHLVRVSIVSLLGSYWCTSHRPLVFLWFNKELRKDYMKTFGLKKIVETIKKIKRGPNAIYSVETQTAYAELDTSFFYYHPSEGIVKFTILMELSLAYMVHLILVILYICSCISYKRHVIKSNTLKIEERLLYQGFISAIPCLVMVTTHHLKIEDMGWERIEHPPYSPDISPSDYYLFRSLEYWLRGRSSEPPKKCAKVLRNSLSLRPENGTAVGSIILKINSRSLKMFCRIRSKLYLSIVIFFLFTIFHSTEAQRALLRDVQTLTLYRGQYTTGRRSSPVPQLQCIGGTAAGKYSPKSVQCYNRGFDGRDVQWECKAEMSDDFQFGRISVTCEGYDYPEDPYILAGSCGLEYELDYTGRGAQHYGKKTPSAPPLYGHNDKSWFDGSTIIYIIIAAFIIYLIYSIVTSDGQAGGYRAGGGGGSGFDDHRPGYPPGGNPPPPGWFRRPPTAPPSYDESMGFGKTGPSTSTNQSSGPGFFTGLGLGALGGYLWGNSGTYRRRHFGPSQFERDTGFYDNSHDQPSTSHWSPGPSTSSHTSSGYGGTSRR